MEHPKPIVLGFLISSIVNLASIPIAHVNEILQTVSLVIGISLGTLTLFHALRTKSLQKIDDRLTRIEERCYSAALVCPKSHGALFRKLSGIFPGHKKQATETNDPKI